MGPEAIEVGAQRVDACGIQLVDSPISDRSIDDQVRVLQDPQVLRDRRTADREAARELADWLRPLKQTFEDRPAGGITERVELFGMSVSHH